MTSHQFSHNQSKSAEGVASVSRHALKLQWFLIGLMALAIIAVISVVAARWLAARQEPLPVLGTVPEFVLIERSGQPFGSNDLRGNIWVADFIFTNCAGTCPIMTTAMAELQAAITEQKLDDVKLVSITVDPERDTPEVLAKFAEGYGAQVNHWFFLTGDGAAIQELANKGVRLSAATSGGPEEEPIIHSNRFVLVDRQARIRGYYDGTDEAEVRRLWRDLERLYREGAS
ncbi:MAG: SCO family protein [candidate division KSB1 bacterium]|nr:SCO family protein [candidate division KSB1 bacterium]